MCFKMAHHWARQDELVKASDHFTWSHFQCLECILPALLDVAYKLKARPMLDGFLAHVYASLMQEIFNIPQRERKPHIQHNSKLDDLRAGFEIAEG